MRYVLILILAIPTATRAMSSSPDHPTFSDANLAEVRSESHLSGKDDASHTVQEDDYDNLNDPQNFNNDEYKEESLEEYESDYQKYVESDYKDKEEIEEVYQEENE